MALQTRNTSFQELNRSKRAATILARQDRLPGRALPKFLVWIIGLGFFFIFFDIGDFAVSFTQMCTQIVPECLPQTASQYLGLPVVANLAAYAVGALIFGLFADHYGRRDIMIFTMIVASLGSLYTVFVGDYTNFVLSRALTGVGVGADLALVNTYINELAPRGERVKYTALIFALACCGTAVSIWLGLYLTTPPAAFPFGLPFALASTHFTIGWRLLYGTGTLLAFVGLLLRFDLPESPRWLLAKGRLAEAERVVSEMEKRAYADMPALPPVVPDLSIHAITKGTGYSEIFRNGLYIKRTILLLVIWLSGYISVYSIVAGSPVLLATLGYPPTEAALIAAVGTCGSILCGILAYYFGERLERKWWILMSAVTALAGGGITVLSGNSMYLAFLGSFVLSVGCYLWLPATYTWTTENYPTRARASGFALVDGIGHVGGGIGASIIAPLALTLGPLPTFLLIGGFLLVAAGLAVFGPPTKEKRLEEVSP